MYLLVFGSSLYPIVIFPVYLTNLLLILSVSEENVEWGVNNPNKFRFIMLFDLSPYHTKDTEAKTPDFGKLWLELIEEGIRNKILNDLPPRYISEFFSAHFIFTVEYIIQTKTKERKIFFETFFDGIKYTN